jgi:ADP-heptose:LPS heptosyltransferase
MPTVPRPPIRRGEPRFLVWRNGKLGNTIVAIPLMLALRRAFPHCRLAVVVDRLGRDLLSAYAEIDDLIVYERRHGREALTESVRLVRRLSADRFSHSLHLKRFFRNAFLARLAGIPNRFGFDTGGRAPLLTKTVPYREDRNIVLTCLSLLSLLGQSEQGVAPYQYPACDADAAIAAGLLAGCGAADRPYAFIHCGATTQASHRLTAGAIKALHSAIARQLSLVPILMMGPGDESVVAEARIAFGRDGPAVCDFRPHSVRVTIEALRRARLFVGQDSGPAHLAALAGTPEIVYYVERSDMAMHLAKWKPWQEQCATCVVPEAPAEDLVLGAFARAVETLRLGTAEPQSNPP